jgi:hypothetical protein
MRKTCLLLAAGLSLLGSMSGCGDRYAQSGPCKVNTDCVACSPCGCPRAYAQADVDTASCDDIKKATSCPGSSDGGDLCAPGAAAQALCISGFCRIGS